MARGVRVRLRADAGGVLCELRGVPLHVRPLGAPADLTEVATRPVITATLFGNDADRAVDLEHGRGDFRDIGDTVLPSRHRDLLEIEMLALQVLLDRLAVLHQQRSL